MDTNLKQFPMPDVDTKVPLMVPGGLIIMNYVGSTAHGTYIPNNNPGSVDDIDVMGVCIGTKDIYLGLDAFEQYTDQTDPWDVVVYELRKFVRLLLKQNPNVMGMLWTKKSIYLNSLGKRLYDSRDIFVSKEAYHSFIGYAYGQLHKMEHFKHEGYMGEKRKALVEKWGYDCKNAAHLVRLLNMCIEFLKTGGFNVDRTDIDAGIIKHIKTGGWTLQMVKEYADAAFADALTVYKTSQLPDKPNHKAANKLVIEILEEHFNL